MNWANRRTRAVLGVVIALGGLVGFVLTLMAAPPQAQSGWTVTDARVSVIVPGGKDRACRADLVRAPVFDYDTPAGTLSEVGSPWCDFGTGVDTWVVGDVGQVAYDPADPGTAVVLGAGAPDYPYAFLAVTGLFTAFGVYLVVRSRRAPQPPA